MFKKKRYEDYSYEEIKEAFINENKRADLVSYIYDEVFSILHNELFVEYKNNTEEFLIEVYHKFQEKVLDGSFKGGEKEKHLQALKAYWVSIALNYCRNEWRKKENKPEHIEISEYEKAIFDDWEADDILEKDLVLLAKAMNNTRLGEKCKTLIQSRFYEGKKYEDIWHENPSLAASVGALRKKMETCIQTLRSIFFQS